MFSGPMDIYTLTVPSVDNSGRRRESYLRETRANLLAGDIEGWTETACIGAWRGRLEPGTVFTIYREPAADAAAVAEFCGVLGYAGRAAMPDQEAVQVTYAGRLHLSEH